jgi:MFS family permease
MPSFSPPTDQVWRRTDVLRLLVIALLAEIAYAVLNISSMPVYLKFDRHYGASVIGLVLVAFLLSEALFKGVMGGIADRVGRKKLITLGPFLSIFTSIGTLLIPHDIGIWETILIILLRIIDGLGVAMLWPAAFALMSDITEDSEQQQAMSLLNMCYLVGIALALPVGGIINDLTGEREASFFLASFLFASVSFVSYMYITPDHLLKHHAKHAHDHELTTKAFLASIRRIPGYLLLAFLTFMGIGFPMAIIKLFAEQQFGLSETEFGLIVLPAAAGMAFLSVPMSKMGQKLGSAKAVHYGNALCSIGLWVAASGALFPFLRHLWVLALGGLPVGIGFLLAIPAWYTSVSEIDPKRRGSHIGAVMTAQGVGAIIGAPLGAFFYEKLQFYGEDFGRYSPLIGCALSITLSWILSLKILHVKNSSP